MIRAQGLTKRFGAKTAVDAVDFEIGSGEVVGFLGPNGAGKTTTMRLLTAFLRPDAGRAEVLGRDVSIEPLAVRRRIGYLPEDNPLYDELEVSDSLHFAARLRGLDGEEAMARVRSAVRRCALASAIGKKVGELSRGYRQRLGLAQAILHDPDVLILDEPTAGLDPNQAREARALIAELGREKTVLLSTHILGEVQAVCSRVLIISGGRIVADGAPRQLSADAGRRRLYAELKGPDDDVAAALAALPGAPAVERRAPGFTIDARDGRDLREPLFELAVSRRWPILALREEGASLEEVFRRLTAP